MKPQLPAPLNRTFRLNRTGTAQYFILCVNLCIFWAIWVMAILGYNAVGDLRIAYIMFWPAVFWFICAKGPFIWKIEVQDRGVRLHWPFRRRFIPWTNCVEVRKFGEGMLNLTCRDGGDIRFYYSMGGREELANLMTELIPRPMLSVGHELAQPPQLLFTQGAVAISAAACLVVSGSMLVTTIGKLMTGAVSGFDYLVFPLGMVLLSAGGLCLILPRAKSVRIIGDGLVVRTWLGEDSLAWRDVRTVKTLPLVSVTIIRTAQGWFFLGNELVRSADLRALASEKFMAITQSDNTKRT